MEPTSRESLRRAVRRAVHHACWQRLEGDHATIHADPADQIAAARATLAASDVSDHEIQEWVAEDEAEFDRAILISDLVARRVHRTAPAPAPAPASAAVRAEAAPPPPRRSAPEEVPVRPPVRTAPSITTLLDDMFAQRRAASGQA